LFGRCRVGPPFDHERQDFALAAGKRGQRVRLGRFGYQRWRWRRRGGGLNARAGAELQQDVVRVCSSRGRGDGQLFRDLAG
jgi:hypothetical protein